MNEKEELERARLHFEDNLADVVRIADLERQLAEARRKLKALTRLYIKHDSRGHYKDDRSCAACQRDRILSKEGE